MSGFEIHKEPENAERRFAPLGDAETFDIADPVRLLSQQLSDCLDDASEILDHELVGFAAEPAEGIHAASRTNPSGLDYGLGAAENDWRTYYPAKAPGLVLRTRNYWTTPGTQIAKPGSIIGTVKQITAPSGTNNWGIDDTAGAVGTDAVAHILEVLDDDMQPVDADGSVAAGSGWLVFRIVGNTQDEIGGA